MGTLSSISFDEDSLIGYEANESSYDWEFLSYLDLDYCTAKIGFYNVAVVITWFATLLTFSKG